MDPPNSDLTSIIDGVGAGYIPSLRIPAGASPRKTTDHQLDLESGATKEIGEALKPVAGYDWSDGRGWYLQEPAGQLLFWGDRRNLVRWDPERGELVPVVVESSGE